MTLPFRDEDIERCLEPRFVARGLDYFRRGKVLRVISPGRRRLKAWVEGSRRRRYEVDVTFSLSRYGTSIEGECTCPVGYNCKHVAAVLYAALAQGGGRGEAAPGRDSLEQWVRSLEQAVAPPDHAATRDGYPRGERRRLLYLVEVRRFGQREEVTVDPVAAYRKKDGSFSRVTRYAPRNALVHRATHVLEEDVRILRWLHLNGDSAMEDWMRLDGGDAPELFQAILETGRARWRDANGCVLRPGPGRRGTPGWCAPDEAGRVRPRVVIEPGPAELLPFPGRPWYLDPDSGECGPLETDGPPALLAAWARGPAVEAAGVRALQRRLSAVPVPPPPEVEMVKLAPCPPVPVVRLGVRTLPFHFAPWGSRTLEPETMPVLVLRFQYLGREMPPGEPGKVVRRARGNRVEEMPRDAAAEGAVLEELERAGFVPLDELHVPDDDVPGGTFFMDVDEVTDAWMEFLLHRQPALEAAGWRFETDGDFPLRIARTGDWHIDIESRDSDWFDLALDVEVDGERLPLLPILGLCLEELGEVLARWRELPEDHQVLIPMQDGRILPLPTARLGPLRDALVELFDRGRSPEDDRMRLPASWAPEVARLDETLPGLSWTGREGLERVAAGLSRLADARPAPAPRGFRARLRDYQKTGLGWLQALRAAGFNGVLADDMGLGKTVQALAHLLREKREGRLDRPALVVAPTSLLFNWRREAEQFAPELSVITLHGPDRKTLFARIPEHDLVLTTYALLPRDEEKLLAQPWHLVVLDEAQYIKNPKAKAGQVARRLDARHRLCLTGTPLENHLGELWSLFDFLMPGLLGDERRFRRLFRVPIEKEGDEARRQALARRVAPFLLRRTKEEVATELPPKTEILRNVELVGAQRDLYESIRLAMHEKVRRAIANKGIRRAHIEILDALLKLRQVCCDPRLLKLDAARRVKGSAKLELLAQMLPGLVEEGRRILLFSQFTTMLDLIEGEVKRLGIGYVKLTGRTRDRRTPVDRFQSGQVPLFLVSLKAGGTGLNLTAADTVIHYDPWWNPAVERQATDRAHRIGQARPVFVYKLIAAGTVEERIQRMQAEKQALADGLLGGAARAKLPSPEEIAGLFAPLA